MRRVFDAGEVGALPTPPDDTGAAGGYFDEGDPLAPREATKVPAWWLNLVQETLLNPILTAGLSEQVAGLSQLTEAIRLLAVPTIEATMPGRMVLARGATLQWTAAPSATTWDPADEGERIYSVAWKAPFPTACVFAIPTVLFQTDANLTDVTYNLLGYNATTVTVRRNRFQNTTTSLQTATRALILGIGV